MIDYFICDRYTQALFFSEYRSWGNSSPTRLPNPYGQAMDISPLGLAWGVINLRYRVGVQTFLTQFEAKPIFIRMKAEQKPKLTSPQLCG
jgi:hypothetical protein